ncbi:MAG: hypothetical protein K2O28_02855 [Clostridia bacterium]|nr:hypothetical protein [Clostridia bacterium]
MNQIDLSQVAGTLRYGDFSEKKRKKLIIFYAVLMACCSLGLVGSIIGFAFEIKDDPIMYVILFVVFALCHIPCIIFFVINGKRRREILKWGEDAIELYAYSKCVGEQDNHNPHAVFGNLIFGPSFAKIEVKFELDGKHFIKMSGKLGRLGPDDGFSRVWLDYRDRAIRIMYSPKYDQVIVLKDKDSDTN